jgi:uncharacterized membrane protein
MTTFTVWKFEDPQGAERASRNLKIAQDEGLVKLVDHAVLSWPVGAPRPTMSEKHQETLHATGWGAFWGILIGALFFVPVVGGVAGAAIGAISKATAGTGISKEELEKIRTQLTEGTSALFAVTDEGNLDRLGERFHGMHSTLLATNLTDEERKILLETFGNH